MLITTRSCSKSVCSYFKCRVFKAAPLFDLYQSLHQMDLSDPSDVFQWSVQQLEEIDLPWAAYGCLTGEISIAERAPAVLLNYPESWVEEYFLDGLFEVDPVVTSLTQRGCATSWDELATTSDQRHVMARAACHGLKAGVTVPLLGPNRSIFTFSIAAQHDLHAEQRYKALSIAHLSHDLLLTRYKEDLAHSIIELTSKQKQVLQFSSEGLSSQEIGQRMALSEDGVKYHLRKIYSLLGVNSARQAVVLAVHRGLI